MTENQITSLVTTSENEHIVSINEKDIYSFTREYSEKGENKVATVTVTNQYAVARLSNIDAIINLNKKSNIALAIELARLKKSIAEENGFKTVAQMVHSIHDDLSETTINSYRRVGIVFGDLSSEIFRWKSAIPQNTSITNLVQAVGLVNVNKDTDKITQEEAEKAIQDFYNDYIMSDRLHLLLPLSKLKEEIKSIQNTVDSTSKEVGDTTEPEKSEPQKSEPQSTDPMIHFFLSDIKNICNRLMNISDSLKGPKYLKARSEIESIIKDLLPDAQDSELSDNETS